jgi:ABC-type uncharacterized transport system permease subunit
LAGACFVGAAGLSLGTLVWHSAARGSWLPFEDNFDSLIWLALLLAAFVAYVQMTNPLGGLVWFVMPIVVLLLIAAMVFGVTRPREYQLGSAWLWLHRIGTYGGAVAFAMAAASGGMYLLSSRRLRRKTIPSGVPRASLERLESTTRWSVTLGFALLTLGIISGLARIDDADGATQLGPDWFFQPKVLLAFGVWLIYAVVLHAPINPSFRGRRVAMLSVIGFVLMIGSIIAAQFIPTGGAR